MDRRLALSFPAIAAVLVGLLFHYTTTVQPGFPAGITLVVGVIVYLIWAKRDKNNETKGGT